MVLLAFAKVQNPNDNAQMFGTVFSSIFGLSLLCSYLGQYGQWATAAAATSPVDVSHTMAYGGDGPFVDDATFPTRRASLQNALKQTPGQSTNNSESIEKRLTAVFVLGTADIKERRASFTAEVSGEITVPVGEDTYIELVGSTAGSVGAPRGLTRA